MRVLIVDADNDITEKEMEVLHNLRPDWEVAWLPVTVRRDVLRRELASSDFLINEFAPIDADILSQPGRLRAISVNAVGYETLDLDAVARANLSAFSLSDYCTDEVAEHTIALMMALERRLTLYSSALKRGDLWDFQSHERPRRIAGQTMGIFGFGRIGQAVARRALGLGMHVLASDVRGESYFRCEENDWMQDVEFVSKENIFARADVISNHMAQSAENEHFFDRSSFEAMERQPIFLNAARGAAADTEALIDALKRGKLYGAGLDVLEDISDAQDLLAQKGTDGEPLNLIITPHAAFYSETSVTRLATDACTNLVHYIEDEPEKITRILVWKGEKEI